MPSRWPSRHWVALLVVALVAVAASASGIRNGLIQDDAVLIAQNTALHDPAGWPRLFTTPYWPPPWNRDLYRPLTSLLLSAEWLVGGGSALAFRILSILLYAAVSVAVFLLGRRLLPAGIAFAVAALFAAHPVHVEAVALGVGQGELVVGLIAALSTGWYVRRRQDGAGAGGRVGGWAGLALLYLAACLFKEHALVLPALWLAAELLLVPGPAGPRLRRLVPGYALLVLAGAAVLAARAAVLGGRLAGSFTAEALEGVGPGGRALTMLRVATEWARLLLWPAHLQADYSPRELVASRGLGGPELAGLLVVGVALTGIALARRRAPVLAFGLAWTAIALFPVSNLLVPTGIVLAERTLLLASIGVVLATGGAVAALAPHLAGPGRRWRMAATVATALLVVAGMFRSAARQRVWHDEPGFIRQGVVDAPLSFRTQQAWGYLLLREGHREEGVSAYQRAIEYAPPAHLWRVRNDLARRYWEAGANDLAVEQLRTSVAEAPGREESWNYLVLGLLALGRYADAGRLADSALARGFSREEFSGLRALADSALRDNAPPGSIKIRINTDPAPAR